MLMTHGAIFLAVKTQGNLCVRATKVIYIGLTVWFILFAVGGFWVKQIEGFEIVHSLGHNAPSNPLAKEVIKSIGAWNKNYANYPILYIIPLLAFAGCAITAILTYCGYRATAFISSGLMVACTIATAGIALFPFMLPSSHTPSHSLVIWDSTSSHLTLWLMTLATVIFVPLVVTYTSWVYRVLRGPITEEYVKKHTDSLY
jgi:cytochrome d ubiquinol oxidase subunit II